ncbi:MAG: peptidyl-prolyl cis-trans isomerase [Gemmatimonadota bacterium]|nr:MAG: peptidyl-prolyl cis-trans isomerase [Gemmatimonadota bacterium]
MLVVALAFVGLMVFQWGMDISGSSSPQATGEVGRVNGTVISYQVWTMTYRNLADEARAQKGSALDDREGEMVEEQAWNQLVGQILIEQELDRRGISVTDEEIRLAFQTTPPPWLMQNELFQTGGQFDYDKYREFFSSQAVDPQLLLQLEDYYRTMLPRARLMEQIGSGIYIPDSELWYNYRDQNEQVRVAYIVLDPELAVEDSEVEVAQEELLRHYEENIDEFARPATAEVRLVAFSRVPGPADSAAALEEAGRIRGELMGGADFEELARAHSRDPATATLGGDLGWLERGTMLPEVEDAAFALGPGEISEPVLSRFGYHIVKLVEREDDRVRASHILITIRMDTATEDRLLGNVDRFERIALTAGMDVAVDSLGVEGRRLTLVDGSDFVSGLGSFPPAYYWAFHDSTLVGALSPVYETGQGWYFLQLEARTPDSYIPFEEAEQAVRRRVVLEEKKSVARGIAGQIAVDLRSNKTLDEVASDHELTYQTSTQFTRFDFVPGLGQGNEVIGTAFGLELNQVAGPIESDDRFFFIQLADRVEADRERFEQEREQRRARVMIQRQQTALDIWLADLRDQADIEDYRRQVFVPRS